MSRKEIEKILDILTYLAFIGGLLTLLASLLFNG